MGTAEPSKPHYIRWQYDAETEKQMSTQSSIMLNMTRRGQHWRLYDAEIYIKKKRTLLDYGEYEKSETKIKKKRKEANPFWIYVKYDSERQALSSCMVFSMTERGKDCHLM